jgi:hypothetical protein
MTSPDREPPPMVPSARNRVVQAAGCFTLPGYPDEFCRAVDAVRLVAQAYRDGWNAALPHELTKSWREQYERFLRKGQTPEAFYAEICAARGDGWNAARAAQDERDQINFDEGRAFERRRASNQALD